MAAPGVQGQLPNQNAAALAVAQVAALKQPSIRPAHTCALRLPPGESPAGYPRRAQLGAPRCRRTGFAGSARPALRHDGRGAGEHAGVCCGGLCKCVPSSTLAVLAHHVHEGLFTDNPPSIAMEFLCHATRPAPQVAAEAFLPVIGWLTWPASVGEPEQSSCGDAEPATSPCGAVRPKASLCCCESWRWRGCASGFMAATVRRKQFPLLCHCVRCIPRGTNSFRLPALHCVSTASGAASPSPAGRITTRTRWARTLFHRTEISLWPTSAPSPQTKTASPARFAP